MEEVNILQDTINGHGYWDMLLEELVVRKDFKNITLMYTNEKKYKYIFDNCYKVDFTHCLEYERESTNDELSPCFFRDIHLAIIDRVAQKKIYVVKIDAYPVKLEIWCDYIFIQEIE